jgi:hypothetical protein
MDKAKQQWPWYLMLIGVLLLAVLERPFFHDSHPHVQIFFEELAFALILASLFGLTIEKYQREEFVRLVNSERADLKRDVFLYAYGHPLHEKIREEIRTDVLECPFHREKLRLDWRASRDPDGGEFIVIEKRYAYNLVNDTRNNQDYEYVLSQVTVDRSLMQSHKVTIQRANKAAISLESRPEAQTGEHLQTLKRELVVEPGETIKVCVTIVSKARTYGDDTYSSKHPIVGETTITFQAEGGLELKASATCKGRELDTRTEHSPPKLYSWEIDEGLLPFQGFTISWSPLENASTPERQSSA